VSDTEKVLNQESADFLTLKHEFLEAYKNLLQSLPLQRRKIFDAYFEEGLSTDEIADRLSLSRKTVQNQLGRAMSFLKTNLSHLSSFLFTLFF
jgi:RNA polymerase sigma-70 factor (ECF subfamily)